MLASMTPEAQAEKLLLEITASTLAGLAVKLAPTTYGVPDRLVLLPGGTLELIELKARGGRLRPDQIAWIAKAHARGVNVTVLTGPDEIHSWAATHLEQIRNAGYPHPLGGVW